ncbi:MAG TPA: hypothetical protein VGZ52_12485 [Acidimicrobiales bacterium]|nr:hypothetical protein [Acidimicrobiales bacterium]
MAIESARPVDDDPPDPALFWRWVGKATRPVVGWVLLALSALFILFGWIGVSGTPVVAKQIPYVVSGGIAGVFLAVFGAYFLGTEELRKDSGRLDRLERMVVELHQALLTRDDAPSGPDQSVDAAPGNGRAYVALAGSDIYHRPECSMVASKSSSAMLAPSTIRRRNLSPCPLCEPSLVDAP